MRYAINVCTEYIETVETAETAQTIGGLLVSKKRKKRKEKKVIRNQCDPHSHSHLTYPARCCTAQPAFASKSRYS